MKSWIKRVGWSAVLVRPGMRVEMDGWGGLTEGESVVLYPSHLVSVGAKFKIC